MIKVLISLTINVLILIFFLNSIYMFVGPQKFEAKGSCHVFWQWDPQIALHLIPSALATWGLDK